MANGDKTSLSKEEILQNEDDILNGLLECGNTKTDPENYRTIKLKRNGEVKLTFRVRPISENDSRDAFRNATKYIRGRNGAKTAGETDFSKYHSWLIYLATVDEDRAKIWENAKAIAALGAFTGVDMIDKVLLSGEKDRIIKVIEDISGFEDDLEELAKN